MLDGAFQFMDATDFGESGFASFMNLVAGQSSGPLTLPFDTMTLGNFMDTVVLHGVGSNASGYSASIGDIQLVVRGNVTGQVVPPTSGVPEPDSPLLLGLGVPPLFLRRRRKAARTDVRPA
ncbi:MAG: PEP-CTERM sorting domain-containing protein [Burkholderiaceae bacterium]